MAQQESLIQRAINASEVYKHYQIPSTNVRVAYVDITEHWNVLREEILHQGKSWQEDNIEVLHMVASEALRLDDRFKTALAEEALLEDTEGDARAEYSTNQETLEATQNLVKEMHSNLSVDAEEYIPKSKISPQENEQKVISEEQSQTEQIVDQNQNWSQINYDNDEHTSTNAELASQMDVEEPTVSQTASVLQNTPSVMGKEQSEPTGKIIEHKQEPQQYYYSIIG